MNGENPTLNSNDEQKEKQAEQDAKVTQNNDSGVTTSESTQVDSKKQDVTTPAIFKEKQMIAEQPAEKKKASSLKTEDELLFEAALANLGGIESTESPAGKLSKGDRVTASVIHVEKDRVFVDLGTKSEGVVPLTELSSQNFDTAIGNIQVGDKIQVVVLRPEGKEGNPIVSKKRADFEIAWEKIVKAQKEDQIVSALVVDRVKGGLVADIGVRGFVPATHVGNGKVRNLDKYLGQTLSFKIIEIDAERKKVVLSNRLAEEVTRGNAKTQLFETLNVNDVISGIVRRLTEYGAFIDLGGLDGLLHISEMSWARIGHPKEVLKEGQEIQVMVLKLDPNNDKISLGLRQVLPDPWNVIKEKYKIGVNIHNKISRVAMTGAFVRLEEGAEAFLPISEISNKRIRKVSDVLTEGQELEFAVIDLRPAERKMILSLKPLGGIENITGVEIIEEPYDSSKAKRKPAPFNNKKGFSSSGSSKSGDTSKGMSGRSSASGTTIGERLGALKGLMSFKDDKTIEPDITKKKKKAVLKKKNENYDELAEYEEDLLAIEDHLEDGIEEAGEEEVVEQIKSETEKSPLTNPLEGLAKHLENKSEDKESEDESKK